MTQTKKSTKVTALVLTIAMLLGMFCLIGATSASAATERVSLYSSNITFSKYGFTSSEIYVQTKDNAADQQVFVHYNYINGEDWKDAKASYVTTLDDGSKIWKANITSMATKYAIKYIADGETIWDNNNGKDYTTADVLGVAPVTSQALGYQWTPLYHVNAVLQNYAYEKNVFVRYTTDGWKSYKDQALTYSSTNENGTENWDGYLPVNTLENGKFEYAICYQVNGTEFWANNFNQNYNTNNCCIHK